MATADVIRLGGTADERIRNEWGAALGGTMRTLGVSRKELVRRLAAGGVHVSVQAVGYWLQGKTAPRPHHQAAIGAALGVPAHVIFSVRSAS